MTRGRLPRAPLLPLALGLGTLVAAHRRWSKS